MVLNIESDKSVSKKETDFKSGKGTWEERSSPF